MPFFPTTSCCSKAQSQPDETHTVVRAIKWSALADQSAKMEWSTGLRRTGASDIADQHIVFF
jgi:hypothetical protein